MKKAIYKRAASAKQFWEAAEQQSPADYPSSKHVLLLSLARLCTLPLKINAASAWHEEAQEVHMMKEELQ